MRNGIDEILEIGDMVEIPAWKTFGMVIGKDLPWYGPEGTERVLIQEYPDQPSADCKWYHLEPGQYEII